MELDIELGALQPEAAVSTAGQHNLDKNWRQTGLESCRRRCKSQELCTEISYAEDTETRCGLFCNSVGFIGEMAAAGVGVYWNKCLL